jgi:hypothetical protein
MFSDSISFDGEVFKSALTASKCRSKQTDLYIKDGHIEDRIWKDRSRTESWTPEDERSGEAKSTSAKEE